MSSKMDQIGQTQLSEIRIPSDVLEVDPEGHLRIDGHRASDLVAQFGSPLYVTVESTLRQNCHSILAAFNAHWPAGVEVFYAIKTNNTLAIRHILSQEQIGGECFGLNEYRATLENGVPGDRIILNGSDKSRDEIALALSHGSVINIDHEDEIAVIAGLSSAAHPARVNLRIKLHSEAFDQFDSAFFKSADKISDALAASKWGASLPEALRLVQLILAEPRLKLIGLSSHVGRFSNLPEAAAVGAAELAKVAIALQAETGFWPEVLDLGGGWPRQREPESRQSAMNPHAIGDYAAAVAQALTQALGGRPLPKLWLEPGRYLVGNAVLLLGRVGAVRKDLGRVWTHMDASTNHLMRIETSRSWYHVLPADRMHAPYEATTDIVGPTCIPSLLAGGRPMPDLKRGDVVAFLDAGMYAEVISNQFNGMPRPANVLVAAGRADLIRRRETYADIFGTHLVPDHIDVTATKP
ncbi:diaminopimelate decarboxylase family protein [Pseudogemmobacter lacusdianii]|uniref:diaminopimelate decarboxylase family protein n=1 Tax=Pseudogemmobacter lacusdianii TaxID=3069608 RepID=UPI0027D27B9F|nr:hypothetical protein [Xinfangfangia sp. CPCC 101601]